jgi:hypothetical protein
MKPGPGWSNWLRLVRGGMKQMGVGWVTSRVSDQFISWVADRVTDQFSDRVADRVGRWVTRSGYAEKK